MRVFSTVSFAAMTSATFLFFFVPAAAQEHAEPDGEQEEVVIVQATRAGRRLEDEPIRVDVIGREELEEQLLMRPGNIAMLVGETPGIRVQVTSPSLGAANIRMQGMLGRYTLMLTDGLPLYGGQALGLMQVPPTDLGQVEVIKGSASALYGASALGGVINLVSRRPSPNLENEILFNLTSRGGHDVTTYTSGPLFETISYSLTGGFHRQDANDIDGDGWTDMAGYERWTLRPRLFWYGNRSKALITLGAMTEQRDGGTMPGRTVPDGSVFPLGQDTRRLDGGITFESRLETLGTLSLRASTMSERHEHRFGDVTDRDHHHTRFAEAAINRELGATSWVAGIAWQGDQYRSKAFPAFDYNFSVPGVFGQIERKIGNQVVLAGSARVDDHNVFGTQFSPRLSALFKPGRWTVRASVGRGFYAPTSFIEEIDAVGLERLETLGGLKAEEAQSASLDISFKDDQFDANFTVFGSDIYHAVQLQEVSDTRVHLVNANGVTRTRGTELHLRYSWNALSVTGSYVFVDATEPDSLGLGRRETPTTPRHTGSIVVMWEQHGKGRLGLETYYTGSQSLDDNPYRAISKPYWELGALGEINIGKVSLFANAENILNVRQGRHDPILRPRRASDGGWAVDAWAPIEGVTINGGVRLRF